MDNPDQKFFEELAGYNGESRPEPKVELVKAGAPSGYKSSPKKLEKISDSETEGSLTIDVYQTLNDLVVESAIAGVDPENLDVEVSTDSVTVRGERSRKGEISDDDYFYQECYWGRFSRSIILPQEVDPENATVSYKNGILTIRLPKLARKKTKKLKVKID